MDRERTDDIVHHQHIDFWLGLHGGTILCIIISMILILLLSECRVIYFGCFWLLVWLVLFLLFISSSNLRALYPGSWIMALLVNTSGGCAVGVLLVTDVGDRNILWIGAHSFIACAFMVAMGAYVPCRIRRHIYLLISFIVIIFLCGLTISLLFFLAHRHFLQGIVYCLVILWVFPFVVFHSLELHGSGPQGIPYDDLALGIVFLVTDFHIIYTGFFWSITLADKLKEFKVHYFEK